MTKKEKQELQEIKELLKKILDKLENLKIENKEYHYHFHQQDHYIPWYEKIIYKGNGTTWAGGSTCAYLTPEGCLLKINGS
jgi:predicted metallo-beta-lactamase superfamily hydrolase